MGDAGPIVLPLPIEKVSISQDGIISVRPQGATAEVVEEVGRLKLVNPGNAEMMRVRTDCSGSCLGISLHS